MLNPAFFPSLSPPPFQLVFSSSFTFIRPPISPSPIPVGQSVWSCCRFFCNSPFHSHSPSFSALGLPCSPVSYPLLLIPWSHRVARGKDGTDAVLKKKAAKKTTPATRREGGCVGGRERATRKGSNVLPLLPFLQSRRNGGGREDGYMGDWKLY